MDIEILKQPHVQLLLYVIYVTGVVIISRSDVRDVGGHGLMLIMVWIPVSLFMGVTPNTGWAYYPIITLCLFIGLVFFLAVVRVVEEYGRGEASQGFIALLGVFPLYLMSMVPALVIKLLWQLMADYA